MLKSQGLGTDNTTTVYNELSPAPAGSSRKTDSHKDQEVNYAGLLEKCYLREQPTVDGCYRLPDLSEPTSKSQHLPSLALS